ncbi:MAG: nickel pincer cofactor biosynthesis protein LarC [Planctomycetes bacterium]|nr:nickel pincer cofactor biosynthesis protein LarC [Planctomycetota bacterium]
MRIAYFDCVFGVSGDMFIGSLLDVGLPLADLKRELERLRLPGYALAQRKVMKGVMQATKFDVVIEGDARGNGTRRPQASVLHGGPRRGLPREVAVDDAPAAEHAHAHGHTHEPEHGHAHGEEQGYAHGPAQEAATSGLRTHPRDVPLSAILARIERSTLPRGVRDRAQAIFQRIGEVEAKIHGVPVETVSFHEIGAVDSIVDVVGAVTGLHLLGIEELYCSRLPQSWGTVDCRHGRLPVPPPASWELLKGFPVFSVDVRGELCTPTGVGIVTTLARAVGSFPEMTIETVGYGAGDRDFATHPNLLRVLVGRRATAGGTAGEADGLWQVETNLDDMTGQQVGYLYDRLFAAGAVEVFSTPIQMKKNRPGVLLSALVPPGALAAAESALFAETTTFGIRRHWVERTKLEREIVSVGTPLGPIRFKVGRRQGAPTTVSPEYEDCRGIAEARGIPLREVMAEAHRRAPEASGAANAKPEPAPPGKSPRKPRAGRGAT